MASMVFKWLLLFHPFFISVTDINHNSKDQLLEVSVRIFTDDFEKTLRKNYPTLKVDLTNEKSAGAMDELIKKYLPANLQLVVNGKFCPLKYVGFEKIEESTWCYFEVENIPDLKRLYIHNSILYDWQPKQTNMCIVHANGEEKTNKTEQPATEITFIF
ncbi:MAG: DUF6702 family protein [Chitinophagaceae bacterium]